MLGMQGEDNNLSAKAMTFPTKRSLGSAVQHENWLNKGDVKTI
jgi:hypothetical protein